MPSNNSVSLSWTPSTDDVGVTKYELYINGAETYITSQTQFLVTNLQANTNYNFTIRARDFAGNASAFSNQVTATPTNGLNYKYYTYTGSWSNLPNFTTLTPVKTGKSQNVDITLRTQEDNFAFLWEGYIKISVAGNYYFRTNSDDGSKIYLGALNGTTSPYSFAGTGLVNNDGLHAARDATSSPVNLAVGTYPIAICFYEEGGDQVMLTSWRTPLTGTDFVSIPNIVFTDQSSIGGSAPVKPSNLTALPVSYKRIDLSWTDNSNNETSFEIWRSTSPFSGFVTIGRVAPNTVSYKDSSLNPNTKYYYRIRAIGQFGESDFDKVGQGLDYTYYQAGGLNSLPLSSSSFWNTPLKSGRVTNFGIGLQDQADNFQFKFSGTISIPTTGIYTFYTISDDGSKLYIDGFDEAHLVVNNDGAHGAIEKFTAKNLTKGEHTIYLTYFEGGAGESLAVKIAGAGLTKQAIPDSWLGSPLTNGTTLAPPLSPVPPSNLLASGSSKTQVNVSWSDLSNNEIGFELFRSSNNNSNYVLYASLVPNTTSFVDTGLFANAIYYYKVRAVGNLSNSGFSAEDSAKTQNNTPQISVLGNRTAHYGVATVINISATDSDGDPLNFTSLNLPSFASLVDNGNKTATLTLNPTSAQQGVYTNLQIKVNDTHGASSFTQFNLTVNSNFDPIINSISDYSIKENEIVTIPLTATDQNPSDVLSWSVTNVPNSFTLTPGANGSASLVIQPGFAAAGSYAVQVQVTDGNGGIATKQFNLTVADKDPNVKVYVRFQSQNTIGIPWNSITASGGSNFTDATNSPTTIGLSLAGSGVVGSLGPNTGNNSGVYPDAVLTDFYYFGTSWLSPTITSVVSGLDPTRTYSFTFYAGSVWTDLGANGSTTYTVGAQSVSLAVQNNTQNTVTLNNLVPAANGTITFTMSKAAGAPVGYLNALVISSLYDDGSNPIAPNTLTAEYVFGQGVKLAWIDIAYNETGYEVYRSTNPVSGFALIGTVNLANASTYTDNTATGNTLYYYKVRAINALHQSGYSPVASITTPDRIPQINPITSVFLKNNQTLAVNISATDDVADHITLSATGLPPFATLVDNGNGTGVINIVPNTSSVGYYKGITVTAKDNSDSSRSTSFDISVVDKDVSSVYLNFSDGSLTADQPWNNLVNPQSANSAYTNLKDDGGAISGLTVNMQTGFEWTFASGMRPGNGKEVFPVAVMRTGVIESSTATRKIVITGLNNAKKYNFVFFNSFDNGKLTTTNFTVTAGATTTPVSSLNGTYNSTRTVQINGITPVSGQVTINITKAAGTDYALLNAMIIQGYTPTTSLVVGPTGLSVTGATRSSISLQWQDRSDNEASADGFEIWRANDGSSTYTKIANVAANVTTYTDAGLGANKTFSYSIRAKKNSTTFSSYSNAVSGSTYAYSVYVNFNSSSLNQAGTPWNNLNAVPQIGYVWNNFVDETAVPTSLSMYETGIWSGMYGDGVNTTNNSGIYPDNVMLESFGLFPGETATLKITGLNISMKYNFTFFASSNDTRDVNVAYSVGKKSVMLNASLNRSGNVTMYDVVADENGEAIISITPGTITSQFGLIGVLIMEGYTPSANTIPLPSMARSVATDEVVVSEKKEDIMVYPNPFKQNFTLTVSSETPDHLGVEMFDINGRRVYEKQFNVGSGNSTINVQPASELAPGVYFVKALLGNSKDYKVIKLIKQ